VSAQFSRAQFLDDRKSITQDILTKILLPIPAMLGRILKKASSSSSSFEQSSHLGAGKASPFPTGPLLSNNGRKLDITFHDRYLQSPRQPPIMATLWRQKQKQNIAKSQYRKLPNVEKTKMYLESRSTKQKVLDWVGSKSRELVRSAGTVDAWAEPSIKRGPSAQLSGSDVKLLGSGAAFSRAGVSDRAKRIMTIGMVISVGGLVGWSLLGFSGYTRAEGPEWSPEPKIAKIVPVMTVEDKGPGVFVWGSNR
jgi:hypothetical protein